MLLRKRHQPAKLLACLVKLLSHIDKSIAVVTRLHIRDGEFARGAENRLSGRIVRRKKLRGNHGNLQACLTDGRDGFGKILRHPIGRYVSTSPDGQIDSDRKST